jgi:hypothetical protein
LFGGERKRVNKKHPLIGEEESAKVEEQEGNTQIEAEGLDTLAQQ